MITYKMLEIRDIHFKTEQQIISRLIEKFVKDYENDKSIKINVTLDPTIKWKWKKIYIESDVYLKFKEIAKKNKVTITIIVDYLINEFFK
jgi:hypothetical protein